MYRKSPSAVSSAHAPITRVKTSDPRTLLHGRHPDSAGVHIPVLAYHNVGPFQPGTNPQMTISPVQFQKQVGWLERHCYTAVQPSGWLAWRRGEKVLPEKPVMITFDDAFANIAEYALPVLERYGFLSTIFVVQDWVGGRNRWGDKKYTETLPCMTEEHIRQWAAAGVEFGSHTRTHPNLTTLSDDDIAEEMASCAAYLSRLLGRQVYSFAYPYGLCSQAVKRCAEHTFDFAFTVAEGVNGPNTDPHFLYRKAVRPDDTVWDVGLYVKFGWSRKDLPGKWRNARAWGKRFARDLRVHPGRKMRAVLKRVLW